MTWGGAMRRQDIAAYDAAPRQRAAAHGAAPQEIAAHGAAPF